MSGSTALREIYRCRIVPAVRTPTAELALHAVRAIAAGGITTLELPATVPGVLDVIATLRRDMPDLVIGAGTILDEATCRAAQLAGAQFIVSPSLNLKVIACCRRYGIPVLPGALTPSEIVLAWESGADVIKVFPASAMGGASYIKSLRAPLPQIALMPMGGVTLETAAAYLQAGAVALGVGADLVDVAALTGGSSHAVTAKAKRYTEIVQACA